MESLSLTLKKKKVPVQIEEETGIIKQYELREFDGTFRGSYMDAVNGRIKLNTEGNFAGMKTCKGAETDLISMCLYDDKGQLVPPNVIEKWPSTAIDILHKACLELCGLDKEAEEKAKKGSEEKNSSGTE